MNLLSVQIYTERDKHNETEQSQEPEMACRSCKWDLQEDQNQATCMALAFDGTLGTVTISANLILSLHKKQP